MIISTTGCNKKNDPIDQYVIPLFDYLLERPIETAISEDP